MTSLGLSKKLKDMFVTIYLNKFSDLLFFILFSKMGIKYPCLVYVWHYLKFSALGLMSWLEFNSSDSSDLSLLSSCAAAFTEFMSLLWHVEDLLRPSAQTYITLLHKNLPGLWTWLSPSPRLVSIYLAPPFTLPFIIGQGWSIIS